LAKANDIELERSEIIKLALWVETEFVGIRVGKLDQSCEVLCKKDKLLYLDTSDDSHKIIKKNENMKPFKVAIVFSGVERNLANSSYNLRVDECKAAAYTLEGLSNMEYGKFNDTYLRDVPREIFEEYKDKLPKNWYKRAIHFYDENARVRQGIKAWQNGDLDTFGKLIFESGYSSIYNYESGSEELQALYHIMKETDGIYGGRFSGAGFKGCCMALVDPDKIEDIEANIKEKYLEKFPYLADKFGVCFCDTANGVEL
jgi:galactokinase/galacturonokinase